ncbi:MAG TPA: hypothetical protein VFH47_01805 [Candidatus Thermoplasmatota archaeon]|nr:hypothetical protein [Candidatus Thermoplasmatota archaeon]
MRLPHWTAPALAAVAVAALALGHFAPWRELESGEQVGLAGEVVDYELWRLHTSSFARPWTNDMFEGFDGVASTASLRAAGPFWALATGLAAAGAVVAYVQRRWIATTLLAGALGCATAALLLFENGVPPGMRPDWGLWVAYTALAAIAFATLLAALPALMRRLEETGAGAPKPGPAPPAPAAKPATVGEWTPPPGYDPGTGFFRR